MSNPLGHCLPALALQATLAWGLGWPALSPPSFWAALLAMLPDLLGGPTPAPGLHHPRALAALGLTLAWGVLCALLLRLLDPGTAAALALGIAVGLGSHLLIDAAVEGYPRPLLRRGPLPSPWGELALNALSLGLLLALLALAPA